MVGTCNMILLKCTTVTQIHQHQIIGIDVAQCAFDTSMMSIFGIYYNW